MNAQTNHNAATANLLAFWHDAGVDACYDDAPVDRTYVPPPGIKAVQKATASVSAAPDIAANIAQAREMTAGCDTLDAIAAAIASFDGCALKGMGARQSVFARGNPTAPVLIVGEGPGAEEDAQGQPFVGKAGQLLDRMIAAAGLTDQVFITNTVYWRPPGNRTPSADEQAVCAPFLERTFALLKPRAVLLLGGAAAKSVLRTPDGIMKLRGQWSEWRLSEGDVSAPVMPTLHPAFLLRQPQAKKQVWADLLAFTDRLHESVSDG